VSCIQSLAGSHHWLPIWFFCGCHDWHMGGCCDWYWVCLWSWLTTLLTSHFQLASRSLILTSLSPLLPFLNMLSGLVFLIGPNNNYHSFYPCPLPIDFLVFPMLLKFVVAQIALFGKVVACH